MCREINYLVVKFELYFPLEGNLRVFSKNCSTTESPPVLPKLIVFTHGVKGSFIVGIGACCEERAAVEDTSSVV
jgi:hypothetical protein